MEEQHYFLNYWAERFAAGRLLADGPVFVPELHSAWGFWRLTTKAQLGDSAKTTRRC